MLNSLDNETLKLVNSDSEEDTSNDESESSDSEDEDIKENNKSNNNTSNLMSESSDKELNKERLREKNKLSSLSDCVFTMKNSTQHGLKDILSIAGVRTITVKRKFREKLINILLDTE
jgi:hypothetical protein